MLAKGWIRASKSSAGALLLYAAKKDGGIYIYIDFHGLNAILLKNWYPLLLINKIISWLSSAKIFTQLDLRDAYNHIQIIEGDE